MRCTLTVDRWMARRRLLFGAVAVGLVIAWVASPYSLVVVKVTNSTDRPVANVGVQLRDERRSIEALEAGGSVRLLFLTRMGGDGYTRIDPVSDEPCGYVGRLSTSIEVKLEGKSPLSCRNGYWLFGGI